jgi:hypothetical protein
MNPNRRFPAPIGDEIAGKGSYNSEVRVAGELDRGGVCLGMHSQSIDTCYNLCSKRGYQVPKGGAA